MGVAVSVTPSFVVMVVAVHRCNPIQSLFQIPGQRLARIQWSTAPQSSPQQRRARHRPQRFAGQRPSRISRVMSMTSVNPWDETVNVIPSPLSRTPDCRAQGCEQILLVALEHGTQVEQDPVPFDADNHGRVALRADCARHLAPRGPPVVTSASSMVGRPCIGVDPPPSTDSPSTISASSPGLAASLSAKRAARALRSSFDNRAARTAGMLSSLPERMSINVAFRAARVNFPP